jgi:4-hydroxybenzoate polyprenyltransferase
MNIFSKYLKVIRFENWMSHLFLKAILGAVIAGGTLPEIFLVGIIYFCVLGYGFLINDYYDVEIDRRHLGKMKKKQNTIASGIISKRKAKAILAFLAATPLLLSYYMSQIGSIIVLVGIISFSAYSARGIRLKERFGLDIFSHGIMFSSYFLGGVLLITSEISFGIALLAAIMFLWSQVSLIVHQLKDYEEDKKSSKHTIIKIGLKKGWVLFMSHLLLMALVTEAGIFFGLNPLLRLLSLFYIAYVIRYHNYSDFGNSVSRAKTADKIYWETATVSILGTALLISL